MKLVHFRKKPKWPISKALVSFLLVIMLVACSTSNANTSISVQLHPSITVSKPTSTPTSLPEISNAPSNLNLNVAKINVKTGNLLIQAPLGFQCPNNASIGQLVLTSNRTTYSQDEIAQMSAYLGTPDYNSVNGASNVLGGRTEPPPTLRWVLGGSIDTIPGEYSFSNLPYSNFTCAVKWMLTNTGNTSIQIPKVGVQLEKRPQENSYQYHLIDACSVMPQSQGWCEPQLGGSGNCDEYFASIQLGLGEKNSVFSAVPNPGYPGCNTLTIAPAAQVQLFFVFSLATNAPKNLIYSIFPTFTVDTDQGQQMLSLPQLASTLAFANVNQFSCYQLQGTTFVLEQSPVLAGNNWCM